MSGKSICRTGDTVTGTCRNHRRPQAFTGTWTSGSPDIMANGRAVIRKGDRGDTGCGHTFIADGGSNDVSGNGIIFQRVGDTVTVIGGGTGTSVTGSPDTNSF